MSDKTLQEQQVAEVAEVAELKSDIQTLQKDLLAAEVELQQALQACQDAEESKAAESVLQYIQAQVPICQQNIVDIKEALKLNEESLALLENAASESVKAKTAELLARYEELCAKYPDDFLTEVDFTKGVPDLTKVNWMKISRVVFPIVPILPMRGELRSEYNGSLEGHRYGASPYLNTEKYSVPIEELYLNPEGEKAAELIKSLLLDSWYRLYKKHSSKEERDLAKEMLELKLIEDVSLAGNIVAGAVLIDSPGGSPSESHALAEKLRRESRKADLPLFTFSEGCAASGGYFLLSAGDEAYAAPLSYVGSIGVVTELWKLKWLWRLLNRWSFRWLTAGKKKRSNVYNHYASHSKEEEQELSDELHEIHEVFKDYVRTRRGDRITEPDDVVFSGECWTGLKAHSLGLVDGLGFMEDILAEKYSDFVVTYNVSVTDPALLSDNLPTIIQTSNPAAKVESSAHVRGSQLYAPNVNRVLMYALNVGRCQLK